MTMSTTIRTALRHTHLVTVRHGDWKDSFLCTPEGEASQEWADAEVARRYGPLAPAWRAAYGERRVAIRSLRGA